jgi:hypothetical protein
MAKTINEKIAEAQAKIEQYKNQEKQLIQKQKTQERKDRTKRLCSRHGLLEKYMPDLITVTDEQFEMFIKKGIDTSYGRNILAEIKAKAEVTPAPQTVKTAQPSRTAESENRGDYTGQSG